MHRDTLSIFRYEGVVRKAIIALKYKYSTEIAKELANICVTNLHLMSFTKKNYLLVPIPLHWQRQNIRGFNQAEEVGELVTKGMNWKYEPNLLIKKISTKPQVGLKSATRHENLKDVFSLNPECPIPKNYSFILFDDVATTGSTLREAAKVLKHAGMKNILGLTIAR